jgi:sucrose-6-phosphate hydrolase SacC (GH32 family)
MSTARPDIQELIRSARRIRELIWQDPHRPRYHLAPPEGFFNDPNGALFWNGRYHLFYLAREPIPHPRRPGEEFWVAVWDHVSSRDLVHWIQHPPAVRPKPDGSTPSGIYSGGAIKNAPRPTLIYHVPEQGTCIAVAEDDDLIEWRELPQNPVIPLHRENDEYVVFDPAGWYEDGTYHALIGNKNRRPGYEGDCTSLFTSPDLIRWEYQGPFYRSRREWTLEAEDAACPDFFPIGNLHMLLMHCHRPYGNTVHYYLGSYRDRRFVPQLHGRMSWISGQLSAPESLIDDRGRNIMFGWMADFRPGAAALYGYERAAKARPEERNLLAWASVVSLPRVLSLADDGTLAIAPAPELEALRLNPRRQTDIRVPAGKEVTLEGISGNIIELLLRIDPGDADAMGVKVLCAPDGNEQTAISYLPGERKLQVDFRRSSLADDLQYGDYDPAREEAFHTAGMVQAAPFRLVAGEALELRVFIDRSVIEVFANGRQSLTQRVYPTRADSTGVRLFAVGGVARASVVEAWDMEPVAPW